MCGSELFPLLRSPSFERAHMACNSGFRALEPWIIPFRERLQRSWWDFRAVRADIVRPLGISEASGVRERAENGDSADEVEVD